MWGRERAFACGKRDSAFLLRAARAAERRSQPVSRVLCGRLRDRGSHSSRPRVTAWLQRPTRTRRGPRHDVPIWPCSRWGLPSRGVLPPARCALTAPFHPCRRVAPLGRYLSVALSVGSRRPGVTWHRALWSPDFPRHACACRDCLADSALALYGNAKGPVGAALAATWAHRSASGTVGIRVSASSTNV